MAKLRVLTAIADPSLSILVDVPTYAELARMRRMERLMRIIVPRVVGRVVDGSAPDAMAPDKT